MNSINNLLHESDKNKLSNSLGSPCEKCSCIMCFCDSNESMNTSTGRSTNLPEINRNNLSQSVDSNLSTSQPPKKKLASSSSDLTLKSKIVKVHGVSVVAYENESQSSSHSGKFSDCDCGFPLCYRDEHGRHFVSTAGLYYNL